jgi:hypothetical protein
MSTPQFPQMPGNRDGRWAANPDIARMLPDDPYGDFQLRPGAQARFAECIDDLCDRIEELEEGISDALSASHIPGAQSGEVAPTFRDLDEVIAEMCARLSKVTREGKVARRQAALEAPEPIAPGDHRYYDVRGAE